MVGLGPGRHFGEWWGSGIQRGYGLVKGEKRFSLFNVTRWVVSGAVPGEKQEVLPPCVGLVPILWTGNMDDLQPMEMIEALKMSGSHASPGFPDPEGIVIYHIPGQYLFKKTLKKDEGKSNG